VIIEPYKPKGYPKHKFFHDEALLPLEEIPIDHRET